MNAISSDELQVRLTVDDARTAQAAGVSFAQRLAGADSADFTLALIEQEDLVERAIVEAGHSAEQARLAVRHFATAARAEWARLASASPYFSHADLRTAGSSARRVRRRSQQVTELYLHDA